MKRILACLAFALLLPGASAADAPAPDPSVHCVRFDGSQYIDTGVPARTGAKIELVAGQKHVVVSELFDGAQTITLDGVVKANGAQGAIDTNLSMYLFALHNGNSVGNYAKVRIYDLRIWQDGELVRDYVPVIADNGAPYLWDKVSKTLFGSETDTPFWDCGERGAPFAPNTMILVK